MKKKVNKNTYDISFIKRVTRKFLEVSRCSLAKNSREMYKKNVLHMQSYFFPSKTDCSFFDRSCCLLRVALHDLMFCSGKLSILSRASLLALATSIYCTVTITIGTFSTVVTRMILQNQVSARRLEMNEIIFRQIAPQGAQNHNSILEAKL